VTLAYPSFEKGNEIIKKTVEFVEQSSPERIKWETVRVFPPGVPKFLSGFSKRVHEMGRDCLMVRNEDIATVRMYVGTQDFGKNLFVSWYLTSETGFLDALSLLPFEEKEVKRGRARRTSLRKRS